MKSGLLAPAQSKQYFSYQNLRASSVGGADAEQGRKQQKGSFCQVMS